jgi:signal transduction histidine kinase
MLTRLQRDLLLLLMALTIPLGMLNGAQLGYAAFMTHSGSTGSFVVHVASLLLTVVCAVILLRRDRIAAAWGSVVGITVVAVMLQITILHEPGLLLFALLSFVGPALFAPLRVTFALVVGLLAALFFLIRALGINEGQDWLNVAGLFGAMMFGLACVGLVVRRMAAQFAEATVAAREEAVQRAQLQQHMDDLRQQAERIASLEHDLRQPLRTVQGYLDIIAAEDADSAELAVPALAAAQRTDRLLANLLDQARAEVQQKPRVPQPTDLTLLLDHVQQAASGLARYYTDPRVPVRFAIPNSLPTVHLDAEQVERAVLNLLDNALVHSPSDGVIDVRAQVAGEMVQIEVQDQGSGLREEVRQALIDGTTSTGLRLGLQQVKRTVAAHGGCIEVDANKCGTTVRLVFPLQP